MTKAEFIKFNIDIINKKYNTKYDADILNYNDCDSVFISIDNDSCFSIKDIVTLLSNLKLNDWKITLNYGDEGGDYFGFTYLDTIIRRNGCIILDGDSSEFDDNVMTGSSLKDSYLINKMKNELVYINNMDEGGNFGTNRRMTYIEIFVNKFGTSNRVNFG